MTNIQVQYQQMLETKRSNLAKEAETARHQRATEVQALRELREAQRHNVSTEGVARDTQREQVRHNLATEQFSVQSLRETTRHNYAVEGETKRANLANEALKRQSTAEDIRHNQATEVLEAQRVSVEQHKAFTTLEQQERRLNSDLRTAAVERDYTRAKIDTEKKRPSNVEADTTNKNVRSANQFVSTVTDTADWVLGFAGRTFANLYG